MQMQMPPEIQKIFRDMEQNRRQVEQKAAHADPSGHKLSRVFANGLRYCYYPAGKDGRNRTVRFCYSTRRNVAGYYLGWREVRAKDGDGKRDQWTARRVRRRVKEMAMKRAAAFRSRRQAPL